MKGLAAWTGIQLEADEIERMIREDRARTRAGSQATSQPRSGTRRLGIPFRFTQSQLGCKVLDVKQVR